MVLKVLQGSYSNKFSSLNSDPNFLFYKVQIATCLGETNGYTSCKSWKDFKHMDLACIVFYSQKYGYQAIYNHDFEEFTAIAQDFAEIIGFNTVDFDDQLLRSKGIEIATTYDLLRYIRLATGQPEEYEAGITRKGYTLAKMIKFITNKSFLELGSTAPKLWQKGFKDPVIENCREDVEKLIRLFCQKDKLIDPTNGNTFSLPDVTNQIELWEASSL